MLKQNTMTKQTYKLTKKIAKHGNQAVIIVPTMLQEHLKPGMIVELEIAVLEISERRDK